MREGVPAAPLTGTTGMPALRCVEPGLAGG